MNQLIVLGVLYVIATLDGLFSGICAASGRNALINKRRYFALAMVDGMLWAQAISMFALGLLTIVVWMNENPGQLVQELFEVGRTMAHVYLGYTAIVLGAFLIRAIPSVDVRSATSTMMLGPLTFLRPLVILFGAVWSLSRFDSQATVWCTVSVLVGVMVPFRYGLRRWFQMRPLPDQLV